MTKNPETMTLREHAEAWWTEQGKKLPEFGTPEYQKMYEQWIEFAFTDFRKVED